MKSKTKKAAVVKFEQQVMHENYVMAILAGGNYEIPSTPLTTIQAAAIAANIVDVAMGIVVIMSEKCYARGQEE